MVCTRVDCVWHCVGDEEEEAGDLDGVEEGVGGEYGVVVAGEDRQDEVRGADGEAVVVVLVDQVVAVGKLVVR